MGTVEIDSFVCKLKQLCFAGISASLNIEAKDGIASVCLKAEVNINSSPTSKSFTKPRVPTYSHRRPHRQAWKPLSPSRRIEAEQASFGAKQNSVNVTSPDHVDSIINEDEVDLKTEDSNLVLASGSEVGLEENYATGNVEAVEAILDFSNTKADNEVKNKLDPPNNKADNGIENNVSTTDDVYKNSLVENKSMENTSAKVVENDSNTTMVYATASLRNSPNSKVDQLYIDSIVQIAECKDHLRRNITKIEIGNIRNRRSGNNTFMHEVELLIQVDTSSLWEPGRTYLWKHLGNSSWKLSDGCEVSFIKIHHK